MNKLTKKQDVEIIKEINSPPMLALSIWMYMFSMMYFLVAKNFHRPFFIVVIIFLVTALYMTYKGIFPIREVKI